MKDQTKYACEKCRKEFSSRASLADHTKAVHPKGQLISRRTKKLVRNAAIILVIGLALWWIVSLIPSQSEQESAKKESITNILAVKEDDHKYGNPNASVVLIEYLDFECEVCGAYYPVMNQLKGEYKDDVLFIVRYYPLPGHPNSMVTATAAEAASQQGKFWQMHDKLFETQKAWGERKQDDAVFFKLASDIGLDMNQFATDLDSKEVRERVERDKAQGTDVGVQGTPSFFLNGRKLQNPKSVENFRTILDAEILQKPTVAVLDEKTHEHADIKIYLDKKLLDLSLERYQVVENHTTAEETKHAHANESDLHLHDFNANVVHKHRKGATLSALFKSMNLGFNSTCFVLETGKQYCNNGSSTLKLFVNGKQSTQFQNYEFKDNDTILITYGSESPAELQEQLRTLTDEACMYSETCPERGKPPTEGCVGGLGSECT